MKTLTFSFLVDISRFKPLYSLGILTCAEAHFQSRIRKFQMEIYNPTKVSNKIFKLNFQMEIYNPTKFQISIFKFQMDIYNPTKTASNLVPTNFDIFSAIHLLGKKKMANKKFNYWLPPKANTNFIQGSC